MKNFTNLLRLLAYVIIGTSATALQAQPANDDCAGAIGTTMNPNGSCAATFAVVTTAATPSSTSAMAPVIVSGAFCANASGNDDVWYTFTTSATQTGAILTVSNIMAVTGTVANIGYAVYSGPCTGLTQLSCVASGVTTTSTFSGLAGSTTYFLRTWTGGSANTGTYTLCLQEGPAVPPNCATALTPASGTVTLLCPGGTTTPSSLIFSWTAPGSGPAPTSYRFFLGTGTPVFLGAVAGTSASVANLLPSTTYNWYVVPSNGSDAVGCNVPVTFSTDVEPPCVVNNSCATATMIGTTGNGGTVSSTTTGATVSRLAEACGGFTGTADDDVWFSFTTDGDGGDVTLALTGAATALDAVIQVYSGACGALTNIGCADAGASGGLNETASLTGLAANTTYYARVYGFGAFSTTTPTSGAFTLTTSGTGVAGALPLELKSFTGQVQASTNVLSWETLSEKNVQFHLVERSVDGARWSEVGRKSGQGDSHVAVKYTLEDRAPLAKAYYRLRSVDFDGKENLSSSIVLTRKGDQFGITSVYPSPTNGNVTVQFNATAEETVTVRVMDMTGRLVMQQVTEAVKDINNLPLTLQGLQAGVYTVTVSNSAGISAPVRFVKQ